MRRFAENTLTARNFEISEAGSVIVLANLRRDVMDCAKAMQKARSLAKRAFQTGSDSDQDDARSAAPRRGWQALSHLMSRLSGLVGSAHVVHSIGHTGSGITGGTWAEPANRTATEPTTRDITRFGFQRGPAYQPRRYRTLTGCYCS